MPGTAPGVGAGDPLATTLLDDFADATGLASGRPPRRYLWTDAFAVCGFLGLHETSGERRFLDLALRLVHQVHETLGRHRSDDPRDGWISGLPAAEGEDHPTAGGLRIGKPQPERPAGQPYRPEREWDRDGQYFHYLTRWMHALNRVWRVTGEARFHRWAVELAEAAVRGFVRADRMYWKMSVDLTRPLVPSMGQHDPLDGRIVVEMLRAAPPPGSDPEELLGAEAGVLDRFCAHASWITHDPLGVGGLLTDGLRMTQLRDMGRPLDPALQRQVFHDAARGLGFCALTHNPGAPAAHRLAFRELGLAIGIHGAERVTAGAAPERQPDGSDAGLRPAIEENRGLAGLIEEFWARPGSREAPTWLEHPDINAVMLAVARAPDGYLDL